jgi:hypothetical protein
MYSEYVGNLNNKEFSDVYMYYFLSIFLKIKDKLNELFNDMKSIQGHTYFKEYFTSVKSVHEKLRFSFPILPGGININSFLDGIFILDGKEIDVRDIGNSTCKKLREIFTNIVKKRGLKIFFIYYEDDDFLKISIYFDSIEKFKNLKEIFIEFSEIKC